MFHCCKYPSSSTSMSRKSLAFHYVMILVSSRKSLSVSLTWMIIAWTVCNYKVELRGWAPPCSWHWNQRHIFFLATSLEKVTFQAYYSLWPQKPLKLKIPPHSAGPVPTLKKQNKNIRKSAKTLTWIPRTYMDGLYLCLLANMDKMTLSNYFYSIVFEYLKQT